MSEPTRSPLLLAAKIGAVVLALAATAYAVYAAQANANKEDDKPAATNTNPGDTQPDEGNPEFLRSSKSLSIDDDLIDAEEAEKPEFMPSSKSAIGIVPEREPKKDQDED